MSDETFLRLSRRFFSNPLWEEARTFSRAEAWLDCLRTAAWESHRRVITGSMIEIPRGGFVASVRYLSDRWQWSKTKVCAFLDLLESEKMITRQKGQQITVVCLCKYEEYNPKKGQSKDTEKTPERHPKDKGIEDIEGVDKETPPPREDSGIDHPPGFEPPLEMFVTECARYLIPRWWAEKKWEAQSAKGWAFGKTPVLWKKAMPMFKRDFVNDGSPMTEESAAPFTERAEPKVKRPLIYQGESPI